MPALEVISGQATAPGVAAFAGVTFAPGDTGAVRNFVPPARAFLIGLWGWNQVAGQTRLRSPRLHDNVNNLTFDSPVASASNGPLNVLPFGFIQEVKSQDTLILEKTGSAVAGNMETASYLIYYQDVVGSNGRFIDEKALDARMVNIMTCTSGVVALGVAGAYAGNTALSAFVGSANMKANVDYALLGYTLVCSAADLNCTTIGIRGVDTGNLRIGMPGINGPKSDSRQYFFDLTRQFGIPLIPVFNAANKFGINVDFFNSQLANNATLDLIFAELA